MGDATEQHIYSINNTGVSCFTCDLRRPDGEQCLYNDAVINDDATRITLNCNGPNVPQVFIYDTVSYRDVARGASGFQEIISEQHIKTFKRRQSRTWYIIFL